MSSLVLRARDHLEKNASAVHSISPGVACALAAGEGPCTNPKLDANEDSLAVVWRPGAVAAVVADSHFGARAGEALVLAAAAALERGFPETEEALGELAFSVDEEVSRSREEDERSESTLLVAVLSGRRLLWASLADSHVYVVSGTGAERLNRDIHMFAGGPKPLREIVELVDRVSAARGEPANALERAREVGRRELAPDEIVLLASDGIDPEMSGLGQEDLARELARPAPLVERVRSLVGRARAAPAGGRDNVALVALS